MYSAPTLAAAFRTLRRKNRLAAAWQVVCGAALAAHGEVQHLDPEGVLHIRVTSREWMEEFVSRRISLANDLRRVASVPLTGIHFQEARNIAKR